VNIDRVAKLAGTTRAAIYRRAKTPGELVVALLVSRFGIDPAPDSGSLREDLRLIQELQRHFFVAPMVQAALAGVLNDVRDDGELGEVFYARFMEPRRRSVAAMLARAADRGEIAPPSQPGVISDLLTGPLLLHAALPPIGPIDDTLVNATIEAALTVCGAVDHTADRPAAKPSQRTRYKKMS
jgi:AcrR family transcriptional regulator